MRNLHFAQADGLALPFPAGVFDLVLSHAVIEHVPDALRYLAECRRVLTRDGRCYLSTAPYLSFAGAHLPRLRVPVPLHSAPRPAAGVPHVSVARRHAPWTLQEPAHENSFIRDARNGIVKHDDLLEKVRVTPAARSDCRRGPARRPRGAARDRHRVRTPADGLGRWLRDNPTHAGRAHQ